MIEGMKASNYRFLSPWAVALVEDGTSINDEPSTLPDQYVLASMDRDRSLLEQERCTARSYNSSERDESLEAGERLIHADNMAQHLV